MTSASTLIRQAAKAKSPKEASKLRAKAAMLRREARKNKERHDALRKAAGNWPKPQHANALGVQAVVECGEPNRVSDLMRAPSDPMVERAEALLKLARHKATTAETIRNELTRIARNAEYEAKKASSERNTEVLNRIHEQNQINVVCAFVAEADGMARANGGPMPATAVISGYTLARVVDALKNAGYTADGLKSMSRFAADQRLTR